MLRAPRLSNAGCSREQPPAVQGVRSRRRYTLRSMRRTKIVATIGPASREPETLLRMVEAGMDVARLNYSHGTLEEHAETVSSVRDAAGRAGPSGGDPAGPARARSSASGRCARTSSS